MRKIIPIITFFFSFITAYSQQYGNEWIRYDQNYFYFPVVEEGVYRITYNDLLSAGVPVSSIDPRNFQLFAKEREQYIYVKGESDGVFNTSDYIEFYAKGNDGWLDSLVYTTPSDITNPFYSLYNDTINYFITWNSNLSNKRVIEENNIDFSNYNSPNYVLKTVRQAYSNRYYFGKKDQFGNSSSYYTRGEGWHASQFGLGGKYTATLSTPNLYNGSGAPSARFKSNVSSTNNSAGSYNHHYVIKVGSQQVVDELFSGYQMFNYSLPVSLSALSSVTQVEYSNFNDLGVASDYNAVAYSELTYPHTMDFENKSSFKFSVPKNVSQPKHHLQITNLNGSSFLAYSINGPTQYRIRVENNSGTKNFLVPNQINNIETEVFLVNTSEVKLITDINKVSSSGYFVDYSSMMLDSAFIILTHSSLWSSANQYHLYRVSTGENSMLIDVQQLYYQYGGGINKHALAIRRFAKDIYDNSLIKPKGLLIIGKGIREATESSNGSSPGTRKSIVIKSKSLVPSFGYPSSDYLYSAGFDGTIKPAIPTGRISATSNSDVTNYLNKVIQYENSQKSVYTIENKSWMKNVLHFGGGGNESEQTLFQGYLNYYKSIIEDTHFGGVVNSYFKKSSDPIDAVNSSSIRSILKEGTSLLTFFGHATGSGFDANVDSPSEWGNSGKYPLVIGNSCYTGDIFQPDLFSASEDFVLTPNAGAIGFISSVKLGFSSYLNYYTRVFYNAMSKDLYGATIGELVQHTIEKSYSDINSEYMLNTAHGMAYHGDPILKINPHNKPDYAISDDYLRITPSNITIDDDSLEIRIQVYNLGKAINDTFQLVVNRYYKQSTLSQEKITYVSNINNSKEVVIKLPVDHANSFGINTLSISLDLPINETDEIDDYSNNLINNYSFYIASDGISLVYPYNYSIVGENKVKFYVSTKNPLAESNSYTFKLDTNKNFNSPLKQEGTVVGVGGILEWEPSFNFSDSTVYYWSCNKTGGENISIASFRYISNEEGWSQAHVQQFKENNFNQLEIDSITDRYTFVKDSVKLDCQVLGNASFNTEFTQTEYKLNGDKVENNGCGIAPAFHVVVLDPNSINPWGTYGYIRGTTTLINEDHQFGNINNGTSCRSRSEDYFIFRQTLLLS